MIPARPGPRLALLLLLGLAMVGLILAQRGLHAPGALGIGGNARMRAFVWLALAAGALYLLAALLVLRGGPGPGPGGGLGRGAVWAILALAAAMRVPPLLAPPFLSTDVYRYVWDGKVQQAGINPYRFLPSDPHLRFLRDRRIYPFINRKSYAPTIYPPAAELVYRAVAAVDPSVRAMKAAMVGFEAVAVLCLLALLRRAGAPPERILLYAWNPLVVWEFAGSGHVDALAVGFLALALLAAALRRPGLAGFWLAAATLTKFLPAVVAPALWRRQDWRRQDWRRQDWRLPLVFALALVVFYLPFLGVGSRVFGFLAGYARQEGITSGAGIFYLFALGHLVALPAWVGPAYVAAVLAALAALALALCARPGPEPGSAAAIRAMGRDARRLGTLLLVALTPHYPWYFTWLLVPATLAPSFAVLALAAAAPLLYLDPIHTLLLWPGLLFGGFFLLLLAEAAGWRRRSPEA